MSSAPPAPEPSALSSNNLEKIEEAVDVLRRTLVKAILSGEDFGWRVEGTGKKGHLRADICGRFDTTVLPNPARG